MDNKQRVFRKLYLFKEKRSDWLTRESKVNQLQIVPPSSLLPFNALNKTLKQQPWNAFLLSYVACLSMSQDSKELSIFCIFLHLAVPLKRNFSSLTFTNLCFYLIVFFKLPQLVCEIAESFGNISLRI